MMTVFCEGRDYGYELAGVAMLFFRGEKVIPAKEGEEPLDNFILAETNLRPGRASLSVTVEREERTWEASEIVPVSEENPDHDCELHLARMLYQILSEITGIIPKWGVLTGIRPVKLVQRRLDQGFPSVRPGACTAPLCPIPLKRPTSSWISTSTVCARRSPIPQR